MGRGGREGLPQKPSNRDVQIWETVANGDCRIQPGALIAAYCIYFVKETHSAEEGGHFGIQRWLTGLLCDRRCILGDQTGSRERRRDIEASLLVESIHRRRRRGGGGGGGGRGRRRTGRCRLGFGVVRVLVQNNGTLTRY